MSTDPALTGPVLTQSDLAATHAVWTDIGTDL